MGSSEGKSRFGIESYLSWAQDVATTSVWRGGVLGRDLALSDALRLWYIMPRNPVVGARYLSSLCCKADPQRRQHRWKRNAGQLTSNWTG